MSQANFIIPNQPGASFRADVNAALQALASCSLGPVEPSPSYPGQPWVDTGTTIDTSGGVWLRQRSSDNTAWLRVRRVDSDSAKDLATQALTAYTTGGTPPAYTLAPAVAPSGYTANLRYRMKFHGSAPGAATINVSGLGVKSVKQYDGFGAKVPAVIVSGMLADAEYDGADFVLLDPLPSQAGSTSGAAVGSCSGLRLSATGISAAISVSAKEVVLEDTDNAYMTARNVSLTITVTASGAGGLDVGSPATSAWYAVWVIGKADGSSVSGLVSLDSLVPTMPAGYTFKARVGWIRTDGTANKYPLGFVQIGRRAQYRPSAGSNLTALPQILSGAHGDITASTYTPVSASTSAFAPPTAVSVSVSIAGNPGTGLAAASQTQDCGGYQSSNPPPTFTFGVNSSWAASDFVIESGVIYFAATSAGFYLLCLGWEDNT